MERIQKFINQNREIFQQMFSQHKAIMFLIEPETGKVLYANDAAVDFYGYSVEKLGNMSINDINILPPDELMAEIRKAVSEERNYFIFPHKLANGEIRTVEVYSSPVIISGKPLLYSIIHDISERRRMEDRINVLLMEKDLILREAHHSIMNNINAIQGIFEIQLESIKNPRVVSALQVAASRLKSLIVLYSKLHTSQNKGDLQIREYFSDLVDQILDLFPDRSSITVEKDIEDLVLDQHTLFIIGIIINELITNIMKYAFTPEMQGRIIFKVALRDGMIIIEVRDNGRGLPESFNLERPVGFGLQLVTMLTEQIEGKVRAENDNGVVFILEFPHKYSGLNKN